MTDHLHSTFVEGCYRCDLSRAEQSTSWAVSVQEWDGAEYHERIVGPFDSELEAEAWAEGCGEATSVFDLMPPNEWRYTP